MPVLPSDIVLIGLSVVVLVYTALFMDWKEMPNPYGGVSHLSHLSLLLHPSNSLSKDSGVILGILRLLYRRYKNAGTCPAAQAQETLDSWFQHPSICIIVFSSSGVLASEYPAINGGRLYTNILMLGSRLSFGCHGEYHLPCQTKFPPIPWNPAAAIAPSPAPPPLLDPSLTGLLVTAPCALTPATMRSIFVSITTPPTIISPSVACSVSKLKIKSSSQTFSNNLSSAST